MPIVFTIHRGGFSLLLVAAALICASAAGAQNSPPPPWPVKEKLLGEGEKKAKDVSGIACNSASGIARQCLLVDDESQGAQIVIVKEREIVAGEFIQLITGQIKNEKNKDKLLELDAEGVAYADGYFYVMGSHGHPRDKDKNFHPIKHAAIIAASIKANSHIFRLKIDPATITTEGMLTAAPEIKDSVALTLFIAADDRLKQFVGQRLDENGLTIEGVAVRDGRLYAGLRGPLLNSNSQAAIFSVALGALFETAPPNTDVKFLELEPDRGVRDLIAYGDKFLVLAGPKAETNKGLYSIYWWDGQDNKKRLFDLPNFFDEDGDQDKPEALLPLDRGANGLRLLVLFDGPKDGAPREFTIPYP